MCADVDKGIMEDSAIVQRVLATDPLESHFEQLRSLDEKIRSLSTLELDLDDVESESNLILVNRLKKEASDVFEKIAKITGIPQNEGQDWIRVKTQFKEFNRKLEVMVNKTTSLPNIFDVMECWELCNRRYGYEISSDEGLNVGERIFSRALSVFVESFFLSRSETAQFLRL